MGVMLGVDPMEPTEKPFAAAPLGRVLLLRLRPSAIFVSTFVPTAVPILVLVKGRRYIVDLMVCLLRRLILPPFSVGPTAPAAFASSLHWLCPAFGNSLYRTCNILALPQTVLAETSA
jgi:hypothetical protein